MPRMDHRLQLSDRCTPEGQMLVRLVLAIANDLRQELGLEPLTEAHVLEHIRRVERLERAEKEGG